MSVATLALAKTQPFMATLVQDGRANGEGQEGRAPDPTVRNTPAMATEDPTTKMRGDSSPTGTREQGNVWAKGPHDVMWVMSVRSRPA